MVAMKGAGFMDKKEVGILPELIGFLRAVTSCLIFISITWGYWQGALREAPKTVGSLICVVILVVFSVYIFLVSFPHFPKNQKITEKLIKVERLKGALLILLCTTYLDLIVSWGSQARYAQNHYLLFTGVIYAACLLWPYQRIVWRNMFQILIPSKESAVDIHSNPLLSSKKKR